MQPRQRSNVTRAAAARVLRARHALAAVLASGCAVTLPAENRGPRPEQISAAALTAAERGGEGGRREPIEEAVDSDPAPARPWSGTSVSAASARAVGGFIPVETRLGHPSSIVGMTVEIDTGALHRLPEAPNQRIVREARGPGPPELSTGVLFGEDGAGEGRVSLSEAQRVVVSAGPGARVRPEERQSSLRPEGGIESDHPEVAGVALRATRGAASDRERVERLVRWMSRAIEYDPTEEDRASAILAAGRGDCSEYARLFVALARATGIPAREVVGLAYTERDGEPGFGYHAWAEVELYGRWVQVDPTWNEPVADATHIRLSHGPSEAWKLAAGYVEVRIIGFRGIPSRRRGGE